MVLTMGEAKGVRRHVGVHPTLLDSLGVPMTGGALPGWDLCHSIKKQLSLASIKAPGDSHMMPPAIFPVGQPLRSHIRLYCAVILAC